MNRIWQLFLGISLLFFTSCFDILEEVHLQKNGSGKYLLTMDMSGIMSDPFMKEAIGEAMKSEGSKAGIDFMDRFLAIIGIFEFDNGANLAVFVTHNAA